MKKDYRTYKAQDLLQDETFLSAERNRSDRGDTVWDLLASEDKLFAEELMAARKILNDLREETKTNRMSQQEESLLWNRIDSSVKKYKQSQRNRMIGWTAVAAACLLIVGFNLSHWLNLSDESIDYASIITQTIPNSPDADITLFHSDNKEISMSGKEAEVDYDGGYVHFKTESSAEEKKEEVENKLNQLVVPKGKRSFVTLTDGTRMWVNAGTVVVFPTEFDGTKREIYVEGEVYLEVARDENKPFIVKSRQLHVEVLGTKFDVSAYNEDEFHHVTLVEGSVQVAMPAGRKLPLTPNQQLCYKNETKMSVRMVDNMHHLAWINGYYEYKDQTMDAVLKGLGKYYGKEITFDRLVTRLVCSGKLDLRNDIREVLAILQDAASIGVDYYEDKIYVYVKS